MLINWKQNLLHPAVKTSGHLLSILVQSWVIITSSWQLLYSVILRCYNPQRMSVYRASIFMCLSIYLQVYWTGFTRSCNVPQLVHYVGFISTFPQIFQGRGCFGLKTLPTALLIQQNRGDHSHDHISNKNTNHQSTETSLNYIIKYK